MFGTTRLKRTVFRNSKWQTHVYSVRDYLTISKCAPSTGKSAIYTSQTPILGVVPHRAQPPNGVFGGIGWHSCPDLMHVFDRRDNRRLDLVHFWLGMT